MKGGREIERGEKTPEVLYIQVDFLKVKASRYLCPLRVVVR